MILNLIVESKNFEHDKNLQAELEENPCALCVFSVGMMCVDRLKCRWESHNEIFVKKEVVEFKEPENVI